MVELKLYNILNVTWLCLLYTGWIDRRWEAERCFFHLKYICITLEFQSSTYGTKLFSWFSLKEAEEVQTSSVMWLFPIWSELQLSASQNYPVEFEAWFSTSVSEGTSLLQGHHVVHHSFKQSTCIRWFSVSDCCLLFYCARIWAGFTDVPSDIGDTLMSVFMSSTLPVIVGYLG